MPLDNLIHKPLKTLRTFLGTGLTKTCSYFLFVDNMNGKPIDMGYASKRFACDLCRVREVEIEGNTVHVVVG